MILVIIHFNLENVTLYIASHLLQETTKKLVHWDNPTASAGVFGGVLSVLVSISYFSLISVAAYVSLAALAGVAAVKAYSFVMVFLKKVRFCHLKLDAVEIFGKFAILIMS